MDKTPTETPLRLFFGHQSVGGNLLQGVADISDLPVTENPADLATLSGGIFSARIGQNKDPLSKLKEFEARLDGNIGGWCRQAMMKFCYVDIDADRDIEPLWATYQQTMHRIAGKHPNIRLLHITVPLTRTHMGLKSRLISLLKPQPRIADNAAREAFNQKLRQQYGPSGDLFDLAALEARDEQGRRCTAYFHGKPVTCLNPGYTDDGGHLNETGRRELARAWIDFLEETARD